MITLTAIARRLDLPYTRLNSLVRRGALVPDAVAAGGISLFDESSVANVEKILSRLELPARVQASRRTSNLGRIVS
jgi:hypothetical protein